MSNILVYGCNGFVGTAAASYFLKQGHQVIGLVKDVNNKTRRDVLDKCSIVTGDVRDKEIHPYLLSKYEIDYVLYLAAQPIVRICNADPYTAYMTNVVGTLNFLEAVRTVKHKIKKVVLISCYDEQTRAVTTEGLKTWDQLKTGDTVLSINPETSEIEYANVDEIIIQDYEGEMVKFRGKSNDLLVTPNHRMLIQKDNELQFVQADTRLNVTGWNIPYGYWKGNPEATLPPLPNLSSHCKHICPNPAIEDILYLLGIYIGDGCIEQQNKTRESKSGFNKTEYIIHGRNPATGKFQRVTVKGEIESHTTHSNVIYLYIPYNDLCRPRLEACLDRLGIKFSNWDHQGEGAITFSSAELCHWFKNAGRHALEKTIPRWALEFPPEQLQYLLDGIIDSDGDSNTRKVITTSSLMLTTTISELAYKLGLDPTICKRKAPIEKAKIKGREINTGDAYSVVLSQQNKRILHQEKQIYKGKVWCLRLNKNKNFLVERNGKLIFCGNSDKAFGKAPIPYTEDTPLVPADSYCTSKACQDFVTTSYANTYDLPICVVRSGNLYGPGDLNLSRLIPGAITKLLARQAPMLYTGVANYLREFIYIDNILVAFDLLLQKGLPGEAYNVGGTEPHRIGKVIELIRDKIDPRINIKMVEKDFYEIPEQRLDATKLTSLGWDPPVKSLDKGVEKTIEWFKGR